jgi:hypothetical protein
MENLDEKAVVQIDADGAVKKCAKNAGANCGYKAGAKSCGACGAMAVQVKKKPTMEDEDMPEYDGMAKGGYGDMKDPEEKAVVQIDADGAVKKCAKNAGADCGYKAGAKVCGKCGAMAVQVKGPGMNYEDEMDEDAKPAQGEMGEEPMEAMEEDEIKRRMAARKRRMESMNVKSAEWDDFSYVCGFERKMLGGTSEPCAACPGGCAPEQGLPTLIEVEGLAEMEIGGKALDSGYSDVADLFLVDVERKDGRIAEVTFDGTTGECLGWQLLDDNLLGEKSAFEPVELISIEDAVGIASKTIFGDVVNIDADNFDGFDAYAVEIDGIDGKSYDVFVSLDGKVLGYDEYEGKSEEEAEMELKREYSEEARTEMATEGIAMEDGSFPIKTVADLKNAVRAYGRAKDKEKAKRHIVKRAQALMEQGLIPEEWMSDLGKSLETDIEVEVKAEDDPEFLVNLMEFQILSTEEEIKSFEQD